MEPKFSAYMTSIRPCLWMRAYEAFSRTELPFEFVIVGPTDEGLSLPSEIKFYQSSLKPSQCQHTAGTLCTSSKMLQVVDDVTYQEGAIRAMFDELEKAEDVMASCHYYLDNQNYTAYQNIAGQPCPSLPMLPVCGMFHRKAFLDAGGIDKRFHGVMGELDLYMRMRTLGYKTVFVDFICNEDKSIQQARRDGLYDRFWQIDRPMLVGLWSDERGLSSIRNDVVRRYTNENLLSVEQNV